jgi:hypothetical protein
VFKINLDRVILASDANPQFLNFWPIAATSWIKNFGIRPTLALISKNPIEDSLLSTLKNFGDVYLHVSQSEAPIANQAKMFRWYLATRLKTEIVTIEDIDTIYLKTEYLLDRLSNFKDGKLLGIGIDVNQESAEYRGKFPASNLTGTGEVFERFFNSKPDETFEKFLQKFKGMEVFDKREDPFNKPHNFSDESLIRALRSLQADEIIDVIARNVDIKSAWMDRSWWPNDGTIPEAAILANMPRPLYNNRNKCKNLIILYFPCNYPWIYQRRSRIWENPDSMIRVKLRLMKFYVTRLREFLSQNKTKEVRKDD